MKRVIKFIKEYYKEHKKFPNMNDFIENMKDHNRNEKYFFRRFLELKDFVEQQNNKEPCYYFMGRKYKVKLSENDIAKLKELYCSENPLTMKETARELGLSLKEFKFVKSCLNLIHDDIPATPDELLKEDYKSLEDKIMERKFNIERKINQKLLSKTLEEYERLKKFDYFVSKLIESLKDGVPLKITKTRKSERKKKRGSNNKQQILLITLADMHVGLENNHEEYKIQAIVDKVEDILSKENFSKICVINLGDSIHGIIHPTVRLESDIQLIGQIKESSRLIGLLLKELSNMSKEVYYYSCNHGNHSRACVKKSDCLLEDNFELLITHILSLMFKDDDKIFVMNEYGKHDGLLELEILGKTLLAAHGDMFEHDLDRIVSYIGYKPDIVLLGHKHEFSIVDKSGTFIIRAKPFCEQDDYATSLRLRTNPGCVFLKFYENSFSFDFINFN